MIRGKQLFRIGKRKCYGCHLILELNEEYFYKSNSKGKGGYEQLCKNCSKKHIIELNKKYGGLNNPRIKIIKILGKKCNSCGVENSSSSFFDIDHIIPKMTKSYHFNLKEISNLQVLCPNCHRIKTLQDIKNYNWKRKYKKIR